RRSSDLGARYGSCGSYRWIQANQGGLPTPGTDPGRTRDGPGTDPDALCSVIHAVAGRVTSSARRSAPSVSSPGCCSPYRSSYSSKPRFNPNRASRTKAPTNAPVRYPASFSTVARVGSFGPTRTSPLVRTPWTGGETAVRIDGCAGG